MTEIDLDAPLKMNLTRSMTQEECDKYMTRALDHIKASYPQMFVGGVYRDDKFATDFLERMIVFMSEWDRRAPLRPDWSSDA